MTVKLSCFVKLINACIEPDCELLRFSFKMRSFNKEVVLHTVEGHLFDLANRRRYQYMTISMHKIIFCTHKSSFTAEYYSFCTCFYLCSAVLGGEV